MAKELLRELKGKTIVITYDDGSTKEFFYQDVSPANQVDADGITNESKGHSFTQEELKSRGYQK